MLQVASNERMAQNQKLLARRYRTRIHYLRRMRVLTLNAGLLMLEDGTDEQWHAPELPSPVS
jgi:hypothetical protein